MSYRTIAFHVLPVYKRLRISYNLCTEGPLAPFMRVFADKAKRAGWQVIELDAIHDIMISAPATLASALTDLVPPTHVEE